MKKLLKKKSTWGYLLPTLVLFGFLLFLFYGGSGFDFTSKSSSEYKKSGYFSSSDGGSDLDVRRIRWHKHLGFERVVFDIYKYNGVLAKSSYILSQSVGSYEIGRDKKGSLEIDGELKGYRAFYATPPSFSKSKLIDSFEILSEDNDAYLFTMHLKKATPYKVFTLKNPARIVIDLKD